MARLTRQVGIRTAEVRLPGPSSAGPAIVKTVQSMADRQFEKQADVRTQEAQVAAASLNFERDGQGNLLAPSLPIGENGLLAPSIYDRAYTKMVGKRYLQQTEIDTSKQLNQIATDHFFDPQAFQAVAEAYVNKVTELAPDILKADVNMKAQSRMVEHYNYLIRQKGERDHKEAAAVHGVTMGSMVDELQGYQRGGADESITTAKYTEILAQIAEGRELNFYDDAGAMLAVEQLELQFALNGLVRRISSVGEGELDPSVSYAQAVQRLTDMAINGEGTVDKVNPLTGEVEQVSVVDVFNAEERQAMATYGTQLLAHKEAAYDGVLDAGLESKITEFNNQFSDHFLYNRMTNHPLNMDWLLDEYQKAQFDVVNKGFGPQLRDQIRNIIAGELTTDTGTKWTPEREKYNDKFLNWYERTIAETNKRLADLGVQDISELTGEQQIELKQKIRNTVGTISHDQTAGAAEWSREYYQAITGVDWNLETLEDMLLDREGTAELWEQLATHSRINMSDIGLWWSDLTTAIGGKFDDPEGMSPEILSNTLEMLQLFYAQPNFKRNMADSNALGDLAAPLSYILGMDSEPTTEAVARVIETYRDPNYKPQVAWAQRTREEQDEYLDKAMAGVMRQFESWGVLPASGSQAETWTFTPRSDEVSAMPAYLQNRIEQAVIAEAAFVDPDNDMFVNRIIKKVIDQEGYTTSQIGYSADRFDAGDYFWDVNGLLTSRPQSSIVRQAPDFYLRDYDGNIDRDAVDLFASQIQAKVDKLRPGENFEVFTNVSVRFAPEQSLAFREPMYEIMLTRADGKPEQLTEDKNDRIDIVYEPLGRAKEEADKKREETRRRRQERKAALRLMHQSQDTNRFKAL